MRDAAAIQAEVPAAAQGDQKLLDRRVGAGHRRARHEDQGNEPGAIRCPRRARRDHALRRGHGVRLAERGQEVRERGEHEEHGRAGHEEGAVPRDRARQPAHHRHAPEEPEHPRELDGVEGGPEPSTGVDVQHGGETRHHAEGVSQPHQRPAQHEHPERSARGQAENAGDEDDGTDDQRGPETAPHEEPDGPVGHHPREPEGPREHAQLEIRQPEGSANLGQEWREAADGEGAREDVDTEQHDHGRADRERPQTHARRWAFVEGRGSAVTCGRPGPFGGLPPRGGRRWPAWPWPVASCRRRRAPWRRAWPGSGGALRRDR